MTRGSRAIGAVLNAGAAISGVFATYIILPTAFAAPPGGASAGKVPYESKMAVIEWKVVGKGSEAISYAFDGESYGRGKEGATRVANRLRQRNQLSVALVLCDAFLVRNPKWLDSLKKLFEEQRLVKHVVYVEHPASEALTVVLIRQINGKYLFEQDAKSITEDECISAFEGIAKSKGAVVLVTEIPRDAGPAFIPGTKWDRRLRALEKQEQIHVTRVSY
jgi:hypothetical protein